MTRNGLAVTIIRLEQLFVLEKDKYWNEIGILEKVFLLVMLL
jgi:hypothetical protein